MNGQRPEGPPKPRLGILATHPIQYQVPLYRELVRRDRIDLEVAFLSDMGHRPYLDPGFGIPLAWDIDLLAGYPYRFLKTGRGSLTGAIGTSQAITSWVRGHDAILAHGHNRPEMLWTVFQARRSGKPYLLRGEAHPSGSSHLWRRHLRRLIAGWSVRGAAATLPIGRLNAIFYYQYGSRRQFLAPYAIDNDRFIREAAAVRPFRGERLAELGLPSDRPVAVFAGKLTPRKRPLDLVEAIRGLRGEMSLLVVGAGPLDRAIAAASRNLPVAQVGFVNQQAMPSYLALGDVFVLPSAAEPWGLVVNEAMACGLLPVVSDRVGCGPDLVQGLGFIFECGHQESLERALQAAAVLARDVGTSHRIGSRLEKYSLARAAQGFEEATLAVTRGDRFGADSWPTETAAEELFHGNSSHAWMHAIPRGADQ